MGSVATGSVGAPPAAYAQPQPTQGLTLCKTASQDSYTSLIFTMSQPQNRIMILWSCVPWRKASTLGATA